MRVRGAVAISVCLLLVAAGCTGGTETASTTTTTPPATERPETTTTAPVGATTTTAAAPEIELDLAWVPVEEDFDGQRLRTLTTGAGGFVALGLDSDGSSPRLWRSPDGLNWTDTPLALPGFRPDIELRDLHVGGAGVLLTGTTDPGDPEAVNDILWLSTDGLEWSSLTAEDLIEPVSIGPFHEAGSQIIPAGATEAGFLVHARVGSQLDLDAYVASLYPDIVDAWDHFQLGAEISEDLADTLILVDEDGNELAQVTTADLGMPGEFAEGLLEGIWKEGLWFSANGRRWTELTVGPGGGDPVPMEMTASKESFYASRFHPEATVQTTTWRSADGLTWEGVAFDGVTPDFVFELAGTGDGALAGVDIPGRTSLWLAADDGDFVPLAEPGDMGFPWALAGGGVGLVVAGTIDAPSCTDEPCQFLLESVMTFSPDGLEWSRLTPSTAHFGMNSVLRSLAVGDSQVVALVEYPVEGIGESGLDPSRLWVGTPEPQPVETDEPHPELGRTIHVWPWAERSFTVEPEVGIYGYTEPEATIDTVTLNGELIPWSGEEEGARWFEGPEIPLEPGLNRLELVLSGPDVEERTIREIWYLPDAEERPAKLREVNADSITVDWVEVDESGEYITTIDNDPGVLETMPVSQEIVVLFANCIDQAIPYRYLVDQFNDGYDDERWGWVDYGVIVSDGEVVQLSEWCFE